MFLTSDDDNSVESVNEDGRFIRLYSFTTSYEVKGDPIPDDAHLKKIFLPNKLQVKNGGFDLCRCH